MAKTRLCGINVKLVTKQRFEEFRAVLSGQKKKSLNQDEALAMIIGLAKKGLEK